MSHTFYSYAAYIQPASDADIDTLKGQLEAFYSTSTIDTRPRIILAGNQLELCYEDDFRLYIYLSQEAHVQEEAIETADSRDTDWDDAVFNKQQLCMCKKRFEIRGDEDFDMEYFNDSLFIIEQIANFNDVIIFDLQ